MNPISALLASSFWRSRVLAREIGESENVYRSLGIIRSRFPDFDDTVRSSARPIFLLSASWGSGSTLLQRLIVSTGETMLWGEPLDHAVPIHRLSQMLVPFTDKWPKDGYFMQDVDGSPMHSQWIANLTPAIAHFKRAHISFIENWLMKPAAGHGFKNWGLKEVRLTADHACYLRWLFPQAKFIFLYRDVIDAFRSCKGVQWLSVWPDHRVSDAAAFAHHWRHLLSGFIKRQSELSALMVRYEDLVSGAITLDRVGEFLDTGKLDGDAMNVILGSRRNKHSELSAREKFVIRSIAGELRGDLGY